MTKKELYKAVKDGRVFGRVAKDGFKWCTLWKSGSGYIYFQPSGRFACKANYKEFAVHFNIAFDNMANFLKYNQELDY